MLSATEAHDLRTEFEQLMTAHVEALFSKLEDRLVQASIEGDSGNFPMALAAPVSESSARSPKLMNSILHEDTGTTGDEFTEPMQSGSKTTHVAPAVQVRPFVLQPPQTWEIVSSARDILVSRDNGFGYKAVKMEDDTATLPALEEQNVDTAHALLNQATLIFLVLGAFVDGFAVDYKARWSADSLPFWLDAMQCIMCIAFVVELLLRIKIKGCRFFSCKMYWQWHYFHLVLVTAQVSLILMDGTWLGALSVPRWLRQVLQVVGTLRLLRLLHIVDNLHIANEFHLLLASLTGSVRSLGWSIFFVLTPMFVYATILTEAVSKLPHRTAHQEVKHYFGSLDRSMLTLFGSISGGLSWQDAMQSLELYDLMWLSTMYVLYMGFTIFAVLNVVTGVFVGSATQSAEPEKRKAALHSLRQFFINADSDGSGTLDEAEFHIMVSKSKHLKIILQSLNIGPEQAMELFVLLDKDGSGELECGEFVDGVSKFQGAVSAIDFASFRATFEELRDRMQEHMKHMQCQVSRGEALD